MKTTTIVLYIIFTTLFTSCNSDIFIDDFITEYPDTCYVENGKPYKLHFDSDDWGISNMEGVAINTFDYTVYDLNGKQIYNYFPLLHEGETGIIYYENTYYAFRIEKRNNRELAIICFKNLVNNPIVFSIIVGNEYFNKEINVSLQPTSKFVIDRVEYDLENDFYYSDYVVEQVDGMTINNSESEGSVTLNFYPFKHSLRKIEFYPDDYESFNNLDKILGENLAEIPIPDIVNGIPVVKNTKVTFGLLEQGFWTDRLDKNFVVSTTIQPGETKKIEIYNSIEEFHVNYKVHASNPNTGEECIFTGRLNSKDPFDYLMLFPKSDNK